MTAKNVNTQSFKLSALALALGLICQPALAAQDAVLPQFDRVLHGNAAVEYNKGDQLAVTVTGAPGNHVLKWHSFDVGKDVTVHFNDARFLNLIADNKASSIRGRIDAVGSVYLVNPCGINLEQGSYVRAHEFGISTAKLSPEFLKSFTDSDSSGAALKDELKQTFFTPGQGQGMGKIRLLGEINANQLWADGSQLIIRDVNMVKNGSGREMLKVSADRPDVVILQSSTDRIDAGFVSPEITGSVEQHQDLRQLYQIKNLGSETVVEHLGEIPLSSADDFAAAFNEADGMSQKYWLTQNVDLELDEPLGGGQTFTGSLDGAYNHISYDLILPAPAPDSGTDTFLQAGLFTAAGPEAEFSNLLIKDSSIDASALPAGSALSVGALTGQSTGATFTNVEVSGLDLTLPAALDKLQAGALSGTLADSTLENVTAGFSAHSAAVLTAFQDASSDAVSIGSLAGSAAGTLTVSGMAAGLNGSSDQVFGEAQSADHALLPAIGENTTGTQIASSFAEAVQSADPSAQEPYVLNTASTEGHLKHFMQPYFVTNYEYVYDGSTHNYEKLNPFIF